MPLKLNNEQQKIGGFISSLRESRGITQKEFAEMLKTSQSAVARMEKGQQNFSTDMLLKISKILGKNIIRLADNSLNFKIEGGHKLYGRISTNTSKNTAVALLCASLLNSQKTEFLNVPKVEDIYSIIRVIESIGARVFWRGSDLVVFPPQNFSFEKIDSGAAAKTRSTLLLIGALANRTKRFFIPHSGGCKLGARTVRPHIFALEKLGIKISVQQDQYLIEAKKTKPSEIVLYESGDTVTENAIMAASMIPGITTIKLASANYMVQELCNFLALLGVRVDGVGTTTLVIHGRSDLSKPISYSIGEDPIESMLFLAVAAVTKSGIIIERCPIDFLELELLKLEKMGFKYKILKKYKSGNGFMNLADIQTLPSQLSALEEKIYARPYPGLNIDNLPFFVPIATQAKGTTLIHDWVYENRALYYLELNKLGAQIKLADPHRVFIEGPTALQPAEIICPPALRPSAVILIAMLAAKGVSKLRNVNSINRGYEDLCTRVRKIGAKIELFQDL